MAIDSMAHGWGNWLKSSFRAYSSGGGWLQDENCNTSKYTLAVFDMFRVFCKPNLNVS